MLVTRQMRSRKFRRLLGTSLSILLVAGATVAWFLNAQAGIASWAPPKIQMIADGEGSNSMCAVADNKVYCWGSVNTYGQLGTGDNTTVSYIPRQINDPNGVLVGKTITGIAAGRTGVVCVVASNVPYCWGRGNFGSLGDNTTSDRYYPSAVTTSGVLAGKTITSIGAGDAHVCVVASGAAYCWGANGQGRLGDGSTTQRNTPVAVSTSGVLSGKTVTSISGTSGATCAVASGAEYCWGDDTNGFLGNDAAYSGSTTPVAVDTSGVMSGKTIVSTMSGTNHTCALASDSTAFCWGQGSGGQLGNNATPTDSPVPVQVYASGAISGKTLTKISAGNGRSCVIDTNSDAYCWGLNPVGDGSGSLKSVPTKVTGASTLNGMKIVQTVNSSSGNCFLNSVNRMFCAASGAGILGNNTAGTSNAPVMVLFTATFNAPNYRLYANANSATPGTPLAGINTATTMTSYGEAFRVRMGIKTSAPQVGGLALGGRTSCALSDGKAYCWGRGANGEIGDNGAADALAPSAVSTAGVLSGKTVRTISVGGDHACVIASDDNAYCWGDNSSGELGDNSTTQRNVPVAVNTAGVLSGKTIKAISASGAHTCVIASDDNAYCWGDNSSGELGDNSTTQRNVPVAVNTAGVLSGKKVLSVSAGDNHTCVIASDNNAYCWGDNTDGKLGDNSGTERHVPVAVYTAGVLSGKTVRSISAGTTHTCAIASDNNAYCWGWNYHGQLGDNTSNNSSVPVAVYTAGALSGKTILTIATGHVNGYGSCVVASDNNAYCWGNDGLAAVAVDSSGVLSGKTVQSIAMGDTHMCVIASDNLPYCWGMDWSGEVGNGNIAAYVTSPTAVLTDGYINGPDINPSDNTYKLQFAQKTVSSCTTQTGFADVTGSTAIAFNTNAGVSNGAAITSNANDPVPTTDSVPQTYISASGTFTNSSVITGGKTGLWDFSLKDNSNAYGTSYCLRLTYGDGTNIEGAVQYPELTTVAKKGTALPASRFYQNANSATPGAVLAGINSVATLNTLGQGFRVRIGLMTSQQPALSGKTILSVSAGSWHTCVVASDNKPYCWGDNSGYQMGTGDTANSSSPVAVDTSGVLSGKTVTQVAAGRWHSCALTSEGKVYCWGDNSANLIGVGWNGGSFASPVAVDTSGALSGKTVQQIAVSADFSCALTTEGKVYCWGKGDGGQLGDGNGVNSNTPVAVDTSGVLSGKTVTKVSLTEDAACVLTSDSAVYCWGSNYAGELGAGSVGGTSAVPVAITMSGVLSGKTISEMSAGGAHVCVLASDNKPYCWGYNLFGQVGDNTNGNNRGAPVATVTSGVLSGKTLHGLDSGYEGTCVLDASNNAYCWGMGTHGELGNGASSDSTTPAAVSMGGALSGKTISTIDSGLGDITTGAYSVCARTTAGELYCWGYDANGQLGDGGTTNSNVAVALATNTLNYTADIPAGTNGYKLQFAQKTLSTCSVQTGFADVTASSALAFNVNGSVSNGAAITTNSNDPVVTSNSVAQTYISAVGNFTNANAIPGGKAGIWDFSLKENAAVNNTAYCLRIVYSDGSTIDGSVQYPEIQVNTKTPAITAPFRFYQNANSLTPGSPLGVTGQSATLTSPNQTFRLRTGVMGTLAASKVATGTSHACVIASSDSLAYCWGLGVNGQLGDNETTYNSRPSPVDTSGVLSGKTILSISTGAYYSCVVASDNNAYCWGDDTNGQLGNNSTTQSNVPVAVNTAGVLSGKTILAISTGTSHTCVIASDNNAYCWGLNTNGQLGNNSTSQSLVPVAVNTAGVLSGKTITSIKVGTSHTCVIASDNNAYCWGLNTNGQLGNNSTTESHVAVAVNTAGVLSGKTIASLSAGNFHNCVVASDNLAYCWGAGGNGRLGNNSGSQSNVAVAVNTAGVLSGKTITSIAAGASHTCAIASDSLLYCWGYNGTTGSYLGNNSTSQSLVPVAVDTSGFLSGKTISSLESKFFNSCAISSDSQVYCWGNNGSGQLGMGDINVHLVPQRVVNYLPGHKTGVDGKTAIALTTGMYHTCTIASDNNAYCWGYNSDGQLGDGGPVVSSISPATLPVDTSGVLSGKTILSITAGFYHTCAIASDHLAYCWGSNGTSGKLGNNSTVDSGTPVAVYTGGVLSGKTILAISTSFGHTCVIASDNKAYCWGAGGSGQLGNNTASDSIVPVAVDTSGVLSGKTILAISTGTSHTCAIASDNQAYCWGLDSNWQLGNNSSTQSNVPVAVNTSGVLSGKTVLSIATGSYHTCAIASDNKAYCWGQGSNGKLGNNATGDAHVPVAVDTSGVLSGKTILSMTSGHFQTCAIASDGKAYCWGLNSNGQLGNNSTTTSLVPVAVDVSGALAGKTILSIETGDAYVCALASDNQVYCWGQNNFSQLGDGSFTQSLVPTLGPTTQYTPVSGSLAASTTNYTLQYAVKSAATCSAQTTGFADVTGATPIAFNTNGSVTTGTAISTTANDPLSSGQTTVQTYISASGAFTNGTTITAGTMGLWDFSLKDNGAPYNTSYCLRVAYSDGTSLTDTQGMPEVRTTSGSLSVGFVDSMGVGLSSPTIGLTVLAMKGGDAQTSTGTLGTSNQKLRVYNDVATNGWSASIAATSGSTALWDRTDHLAKYDFNDASGSTDGGDSDLLGGALTLSPGSGNIVSPTGCATTGLSLGSSASFSEGVTNSLTLFSASNTAAMGCNYDLTNIGLSQAVPAGQLPGTYTLDMTVTVVAL